MSKVATRPGAGAVGSQPTGGTDGARVGNTPAVVIDIDAPPQRHTTGGGKVEKTSKERFAVRENGKKANGK